MPIRPARVASVSVPVGTESEISHVGSSGPASGSCRTIPSPEAAEKVDRLTGSPGGTSWLGIDQYAAAKDVTSEVLPLGSVAVAVITGNPAGAVKGIANATCPLASVVTSSVPRKSWASPAPPGP